MKGYIYVYDQRSAYLKELFLENGVEIVDSIEDEADFYFVKDQKLSRKNVFSLVYPIFKSNIRLNIITP